MMMVVIGPSFQMPYFITGNGAFSSIAVNCGEMWVLCVILEVIWGGSSLVHRHSFPCPAACLQW